MLNRVGLTTTTTATTTTATRRRQASQCRDDELAERMLWKEESLTQKIGVRYVGLVGYLCCFQPHRHKQSCSRQTNRHAID